MPLSIDLEYEDMFLTFTFAFTNVYIFYEFYGS